MQKKLAKKFAGARLDVRNEFGEKRRVSVSIPHVGRLYSQYDQEPNEWCMRGWGQELSVWGRMSVGR